MKTKVKDYRKQNGAHIKKTPKNWGKSSIHCPTPPPGERQQPDVVNKQPYPYYDSDEKMSGGHNRKRTLMKY